MNAHVVVVDDDTDAREYATTVLERNGYAVRSFSAPMDMATWLTSGGSLDVLVCDVVLPQMSGMELAATVRRESPATAVVLCTGDPHALEDALARGLLPLPKPYSPSQLLALVEDAVAASRSARRDS